MVVGEDNKLRFRKVDVVWREGGDALVGSGLKDGDRVLLTEIPDVVEEMQVRIVGDEAGSGKRRSKRRTVRRFQKSGGRERSRPNR